MQLYIGALCLTLLAKPMLILTQSDNSCFTPIGELGYCVPVDQCIFLLDIQAIYRHNVPPSILNQLKQMICKPRSKLHFCCPSSQVISRSTITTEGPSTKQTSQSHIDSHGLELLNSVKDCGKTYVQTSKVMMGGGEVAEPGEFPWMVLLKYSSFAEHFRCAGTLISDRFVLTAAHCISMSDKLIGVRLGEHNLETEKDCQPTFPETQKHCLPPYEEYGIEAIRSHPNYNFINNDIALIKLNQTVMFKQHINPICLPIERNSQQKYKISDSTSRLEQRFYISGWGRTEKSYDGSVVLLKALVYRQNHSICSEHYVDAPVNKNHICAVGDSIAHTCRGDSGGPLFSYEHFKESRRFVQYGIISYGGRRCGIDKNQPGVFSSVIDLLPWITQNLY